MSSKLNSVVRYEYMRGDAAWEYLRVKADMVLFAGNYVWTIPERIRGIREYVLCKSTLPLPLPDLPQNVCHRLCYKSVNVNRNTAGWYRDVVESDLEFIGLIVFENKLKPETTPVISELHDANIRTVMVTGQSVTVNN